MNTKEELMCDVDPRNCGLDQYRSFEVQIDIRDVLVELNKNLAEFKNLFDSYLKYK